MPFVSRSVVALTFGLVLASVAAADIPPPPPPKGMKYVTVIHKFTTESEIPDYDFYTIVTEPGDKYTIKAVELTPKSSVEWNPTKFQRFKLTAVPKGAARKYDTEKAFFAALRRGNVEGQAETRDNFWRSNLAPEAEKEPAEGIYKITKVNEKEGIVISVTDKRPKGCEVDEDDLVSAAPRGGMWVAGLALAATFVTGGLWFNRRRVG